MTKAEKEICGKLVDEAIRKAEQANAEFEEYLDTLVPDGAVTAA